MRNFFDSDEKRSEKTWNALVGERPKAHVRTNEAEFDISAKSEANSRTVGIIHK
jgi:hypothetical protein